MTSVCSRRSEASQARFTALPGAAVGHDVLLTHQQPDLRGTNASARRSSTPAPTNSSLVNGPYMSAVSSRVAPRSSARCNALSDSSPRCRDPLYAQLIGMHPSPTAPTESAAAPIVLRSTCS
ncbi:hypothetical protein SALBM217S_05606 [Streptomyces griseoloalbus]